MATQGQVYLLGSPNPRNREWWKGAEVGERSNYRKTENTRICHTEAGKFIFSESMINKTATLITGEKNKVATQRCSGCR